MRWIPAAALCCLSLAGCAAIPAQKPVDDMASTPAPPQPFLSPRPLPPPPPPPPSGYFANPAAMRSFYKAPVYPGFEAIYGVQGTTMLLILIGKQGSPLDIKVVRSSGSRNLDRAAITAAIAWRFRPEIKYGYAVDGYVRVPVVFTDTLTNEPDWWQAYRQAPISVDRVPIGYTSVAAAVAGVAARVHQAVYDGTGDQFHIYRIYDAHLAPHELWYFTDISTDRAMAVRYTFAGTPDHPMTNVAVLCDHADLCGQRMAAVMSGPYAIRMAARGGDAVK
ncbi:energy transducer TonB [Rhodanobacter denitrificans]|uniref:Energy transducer TonB n=1 Tax=Rhodanobacter denitrificans TaxID=666685 RepID=A0A368KB88_9GAMM|nr:energy transducer TonB [Rhodanobacter denitrificans]RCS29201.1 energy transducer TonB [Rhodanobacter denitrificans]